MSKGPSIPEHVAIIMDGNGRWATQRGLPRLKGHEEGAESVRAVLRVCRDVGVKYLTLYAFSSENWVRPPSEIAGLMGLLKRFLKTEEAELHKNDVRLRTIGRTQDLPRDVQKELFRVIEATKDHKKATLVLALSYGGRAEITDAVRKIAGEVKHGDLDPKKINDKTLSKYLYAPDIPDPDMMIRTSGEMRLSNFLLWQLSYAEIYVTGVPWPAFREAEFMNAIQAYQKRHRRFGDIK